MGATNAKQISLRAARTRNLQRWKSSTEDIIEEAQQALRDHRQPWWYPEQGVFEAADTFDKELQQRCNTAHSTFHELKRGERARGPSGRTTSSYAHCVFSVTRSSRCALARRAIRASPPRVT